VEQAPSTLRRWDPIVKLTHWGIVVAVIGNALVTREGSGWHIWLGYGLVALLALRLLWGLIGPAEARFSAFPPSPARAFEHIGEIGRGEVHQHRSHNPLGALMAYAIWGTLLVIAGTGIAMSGPPPADPWAKRDEHGAARSEADEAKDENESRERPSASAAGTGENGERQERGESEEHEQAERQDGPRQPPAVAPAPAATALPVAAGSPPPLRAVSVAVGEGAEDEEEEEEGGLGEVHELAVNLLYVLIALHLAGVLFETRRAGQQIVRAMIPGGSRRN